MIVLMTHVFCYQNSLIIEYIDFRIINTLFTSVYLRDNLYFCNILVVITDFAKRRATNEPKIWVQIRLKLSFYCHFSKESSNSPSVSSHKPFWGLEGWISSLLSVKKKDCLKHIRYSLRGLLKDRMKSYIKRKKKKK